MNTTNAIASGSSLVLLALVGTGCPNHISEVDNESAQGSCAGDLILLEELPRSHGQNHHSFSLTIEDPGDYCFALINLAGDNVSSLSLEIESESIFEPSDFNRNTQWIARKKSLTPGDYQLLSRVHSDPDARTALAVFSRYLEGTSFTVGPDGGEFHVGDLRIRVPAGAVSQPQEVVVRIIEPEPGDPVVAPIVAFEPHGFHFNTPISVTAPIDPARIQENRLLKDIEGWLDYERSPTWVNEDELVLTTSISHFSKLYWVYDFAEGPLAPAVGEKGILDPSGVTRYDFSDHWNPFVVYRIDLTNPFLSVQFLPSAEAPDQGDAVRRLQHLNEIAQHHGVLSSNIVSINGNMWADPQNCSGCSFGAPLETHYNEGERYALRTDGPGSDIAERHYVFTKQPDGPVDRTVVADVFYSGSGMTQGWNGTQPELTYEAALATVFGSASSILINGAPQNGVGLKMNVNTSRTALGLSADRDHLFLLVAGGNDIADQLKAISEADGFWDTTGEILELFQWTRGLDTHDAGSIMKLAGAHNAIFGDGGSSSSALVGDTPVSLQLGTNADACGPGGCPVMNMVSVLLVEPENVAGIVVDDEDDGFQVLGNEGNFAVFEGYGYGSLSTLNTESSVEDRCVWTATLDPGRYEVFAFVPQYGGTSESASYQIYHSSGRSCSTISQLDADGQWVSLGVQEFAGESAVELLDATGESEYTHRISCDAVWFNPTNKSVNAGACADACQPEIFTTGPTTATLDHRQQFVATGACLPPTTKPWIADCENLVIDSLTDAELRFSCTPSWTTGGKVGYVKDKAGGVILDEFVVSVD